ncbi:MAG: DUF721 domain-containing protein [Spirochaetota bacterium]
MRKADDLIQRFLDTIGQSEGSVYVGLFRSWQPIVGERIAAHAQPVDVRGHSLIVEADHPGWVQMVMMKRSRIIGELRRRYPELGITGLAVRVVEKPGAPRPGTDRPTPPGSGSSPAPGPRASAINPETRDSGHGATEQPEEPPQPPTRDENEALERIEDADLRDVLSRLRRDLGDTGE